jgi:hypothetical protein
LAESKAGDGATVFPPARAAGGLAKQEEGGWVPLLQEVGVFASVHGDPSTHAAVALSFLWRRT